MGLILGGALLIALALWTVIAPRQQWWLLTSWKYRDPDANEPSDLSYNLARAAGVATIAVILILGRQVIDFERSPEKSAADARKARDQRFGTSTAQLTPAPPTVPQSALRKVSLLRYATLTDETPDFLTGVGDPPAGTNLILAVDGAHEVEAMTVTETATSVTVTLHGGCAPKAPRIICDPTESATPLAPGTQPMPPVRLFPLALEQPLGARPLLDGSTGEEAIGR